MVPHLTVRDLMKTDVTALTPGTTLQEARTRMIDLGIRHMPVIDHDRHVVGMLSHRDLAHALDPHIAAQGLRTTISTGEAMTTKIVVAHPETPASMAVEAMITAKIGAVPVVDETNHLVGILTEADFLEIAREALLGMEPKARARS